MTGPKYDVLVSYNNNDEETVRQLVEQLETGGIRVWFARREVSPGVQWVSELEAGLANSRGCVICVGPVGLGTWQVREKGLALTHQAQHPEYLVIPVLLPGAQKLGADLLSTFDWVDLRAGLTDANAIDRLVSAIRGRKAAGRTEREPVKSGVSLQMTGFERAIALTGRVAGLSPTAYGSYKVVVYVLTNKWYIHPEATAAPGQGFALIAVDGSFRLPTVWRGYQASRLAFLLVPRDTWVPPAVDIVTGGRQESALLSQVEGIAASLFLKTPEGI